MNGWLLAELERRFDYGLDELARRFDRSVSWVSRRLALVEVLPEAIQQQVREGKISAQVALKFLVPVARQSLGIASGWRRFSPSITARQVKPANCTPRGAKVHPRSANAFSMIPSCFSKRSGRPAQEKAPAGAGAELLRDLEMVVAIVNRAQRRMTGAAATELDCQQSRAARHQI